MYNNVALLRLHSNLTVNNATSRLNEKLQLADQFQQVNYTMPTTTITTAWTTAETQVLSLKLSR